MRSADIETSWSS